ncbi:uncharacterized protein IWZ02DRAFT_521558 [Phyllosticta citriasiana]|uniref:uncharacterized protein n=1 Tax=Phyllosticta citriasiana TaxID=595635 RepID=UPI0030FD4D65
MRCAVSGVFPEPTPNPRHQRPPRTRSPHALSRHHSGLPSQGRSSRRRRQICQQQPTMCYNTIRHACGTRIRRQSLSCSCGTNGGDRECSLRCGTCQQCGHGSAAIAPMTRITTTNTNAAANATETSKPDPDDAAASDAAGSASTTATTSPTASSPTAAPGMPKLFPVPGVAVAAAAAAAAELAVASSGPEKVRSANVRYSYP